MLRVCAGPKAADLRRAWPSFLWTSGQGGAKGGDRLPGMGVSSSWGCSERQPAERLENWSFLFLNKIPVIKKVDHSYIAGGNVKCSQALWKRVWQFLSKVKMDPAIAFLDIYPRKRKPYFHSGTCTWMFIAALFVKASNWKLAKCPSMDE